MNKTENKNLTQIVIDVQNGVDGAFEKLYNETIKYSYATASLLLKNKEDIEDVLQNSYMYVAKYLNDLRNPESFLSWLGVIVKHECKKHIIHSIKSTDIYFAVLGQNEHEHVPEEDLPFDLIEQKENKYIVRNGVKFGVLGYTYGTNGISLPSGKEYLVNLINKDRIKEDVERLKGTCDSIIVSIHWGEEYQTKPNAEQKELAKFIANLGVDVIIGEHPHVIQPMDWVERDDGKQTLVIYSLGNFLSSQVTIEGMLGGCAAFDIRKNG